VHATRNPLGFRQAAGSTRSGQDSFARPLLTPAEVEHLAQADCEVEAEERLFLLGPFEALPGSLSNHDAEGHQRPVVTAPSFVEPAT
jgi:hypothetical protein